MAITKSKNNRLTNDMVDKLIPNAQVLRRILLLEWMFLGVYALIKILGSNMFAIWQGNEHFISFCNFVDSHLIIKMLVAIATSFLQFYVYYNAILKQWTFNKVQFIIYAVSIPIEVILKLAINNLMLSYVLDCIMLFVIPFFLKWKGINLNFIFEKVIGSFALLVFIQFVSLFIKCLAIKVLDDNTLISLIYSIDIYIMLSLYYLYVNRGKNYKGESMGAFFVLFLGKNEDQLNKMISERERKIADLEKSLKEAIGDKHTAKIENKIHKLYKEIALIEDKLKEIK